MPAVQNLIHQETTGTGTGDLTLSALNGKITFADSTYGFGSGADVDQFDYFISHQSASEWEYGTGHMSDANTLVRDTVRLSSNSDAAVNFSAGTKDVTNDVPASVQYYHGISSIYLGDTGLDTELKRSSAGVVYMNSLALGDTGGDAVLARSAAGAMTLSGVELVTDTGTQTLIGKTMGQTEFTGPVLLDDDTSASAPPMAFSNDANTGLSHPAADILALVTGGSERVRVNDSGLVGIGVDPSYPIDVQGHGDNITLHLGADQGGASRTDATNKRARMTIPHYTLAEEPICIFYAQGTTGINVVYLGGGTANMNACTQYRFYTGANNTTTSGSEQIRLDNNGNWLMQGTSAAASAVGSIGLYNGTAPTGSLTDGVVLYAENVSASSELKVRDEGGTVTTLSPHNFEGYTPDPADPFPWSHYHKNPHLRLEQWVDMSGAIRALEALTGKTFIHTKAWNHTEGDRTADAMRQAEERREKNIEVLMEEEIEIPLAEVVEEVDETVKVDSEKMEQKYQLNLETMKAEACQVKAQPTEVPTGRKVKRLKPGARFDEKTGKCFRCRTREEAEALAPLESVKPLPAWIVDRMK